MLFAPLIFVLVTSGAAVSQGAVSVSNYQHGKDALDGKQYAEADRALAAAEKESPGATNALALRAKALIHLDRFPEAETCLYHYLERNADSADAKYLLGYVLFRQNKARESLAAYTQAAKLQRPTADDFKVVGLDYVLLNDYPDAVKWLEQAVREAPDDGEVRYYLGRAYYVQNSFDAAIAAFEQALRIDPGSGRAQNNLGLAYTAKNQPDLAERAYRAAIALDEKAGKPTEQPYLNLAELVIHDGRNEEALKLLEKAQIIGGETSKTQELRGRVYLAQDRLADAEKEFRSALASKPDDGSLHYLLGRVLKREGKSSEAETEFAKTKALLGTKAPE